MARSVPLRVLFLHNPKAGGSAVADRFTAEIGENRSALLGIFLPSDRENWTYSPEYDFISGHCGYELFREIGKSHHLVTNFRHPVDRIVSLYDFWRNNIDANDPVERDMALPQPPLTAIGPHLARTLSFSEFIRRDDEAVSIFIRNAHARQLLDTPWKYWELKNCDLRTLKRRIRNLHWFYICEQPAASNRWFARQFPEVPDGNLSIENPTDYTEKPKTVPTQEDIDKILRDNRFDLEIYNYAQHILQKRLESIAREENAARVKAEFRRRLFPWGTASASADKVDDDLSKATPMTSRIGFRRFISAGRFFDKLPATIQTIEARIAALEQARLPAPDVSPAVAPEPEPVVAAPPIEPVEAPAPEPSQRIAESFDINYLAYPEQIARDRPIYIVGLGTMANWTLRLLRSRGYTVTAFIADVNDPPETYRNLPVIARAQKLNELSIDDVVLIASPHRDSLVREFTLTENLFDATELYQYVTEFCEKDSSDILIDDLAVAYWRTAPEQIEKYGEVWRRLKKVPTHQYVRNIEKAAGPGSRYVVNIGCHDGISVDPCYPLYKDGWKGWASDGKPADHPVGRAAQRNLALPGVALTLDTFVTPNNIKDLLTQHGAPFDCDLIKIDIDSYDGPVIQTMLEGGWRPRVFCVEINADFPPPFRFMVEYKEDEAKEWSAATAEMNDQTAPWNVGIYGCSAAWAANIFHKYGYRFAQYEFGFPKMIGGIRDMVFIRDDVFDAAGARPGIAWDDAYYAEPLGWSHVKSGLKIDIRDWRHAKDPQDRLAAMKLALREGTKKVLGRDVSFVLEC